MKWMLCCSLAFFCWLNAAFAQTDMIDDSVLIDGHYRTFHINKPAADNQQASLVFVLHGSGGNGIKSMSGAKKLVAMANQEKVVVICPDGYKRNWNECRKNAPAAANMENIDELTFFSQMIDYCVSHFHINPAKVFVVGTSGGGHMAYKLAMTMPEKFKAITAIVANIPDTSNFDCVAKEKALPVMIINGTSDSTNPYYGGKVKNKGLVRSTDETFHYWASLAGYKGEPKMEALPDTDPTDGKTIERYTFKEKGKPEVVLLKVINGTHGNPKDIDVFVESWQFFKRQISK